MEGTSHLFCRHGCGIDGPTRFAQHVRQVVPGQALAMLASAWAQQASASLLAIVSAEDA